MSTPSRTSSGGEGSLRPDAEEFQPSQVARKESNFKPIRTHSRRGDVLATLDQIPFTPSQGVCTPSPTNMAAMWVPHPFFQHHGQAWGTVGGYSGSPGPSSGGSDSSMLQSVASQPGTPGGMAGGAGGATMFAGPPVMWSGFCQPLPYSPTALQIAAASGALGSDPSTPVRGSRPGSASSGGGMAAGASFVAVMPGSPMMASPGQMVFAQYFGGMGGSSRSLSPPESKDSGSGDEGEGSDGMSTAGSGGLEVSDAAHQIATAMCAAQQLPGEPPQPLLELASLLHAYGLVSAVPAFPGQQGSMQGAPLSPDSRRQAARARMKAAPRLNPDGSVRLNARQRRTLRRAQERAMKALLEAQTKAHGITPEQAANNLASIGVASMLLGSPPPATAPMHSPMQVPYMAAPAMALSPGAAMPGMMDYSGLMAAGMHPAAAASLLAQQQLAAGFDVAAGGYGTGMGMGLGGADLAMGMGMHMPAMMAATPPPNYAPASRLGGSVGGGYPGSGQRSASFRGTPGGGRLSRFAPSDAVAAY